MSKIVLLGDTHFGIRSGAAAERMGNRFELFYNFMFEYMKDNNLNRIIQFGDLFDRRKSIDFTSLGRAKEFFFEPIRQNNFQFETFIGNHDIPFKNTLKYNSPSLVLGEYPEFILYDKPTSVELAPGVTAAVIPWICDSNMTECMKFIENSTDTFCFGHFEIQGFEFSPGSECEHGILRTLFWKFHHVYSGHFHHISTQDNITFIGSPCQLTWQDYADPRGFFVLDTDTLQVEFIANPFENFHKVIYNEKQTSQEEIEEFDYSPFKDTSVKVYVRSAENALMYETFIGNMEAAGALIKVVEDPIEAKESEDDEEVTSESDSVEETFRKAAESYSDSADPAAVTALLMKLYNKVLND